MLELMELQAQLLFFFYVIAGVIWVLSSRWSSFLCQSQVRQSKAETSEHGTNLVSGSFLCLLLECYCVLLISAHSQRCHPWLRLVLLNHLLSCRTCRVEAEEDTPAPPTGQLYPASVILSCSDSLAFPQFVPFQF